jgi:hypothetical protein
MTQRDSKEEAVAVLQCKVCSIPPVLFLLLPSVLPRVNDVLSAISLWTLIACLYISSPRPPSLNRRVMPQTDALPVTKMGAKRRWSLCTRTSEVEIEWR